MTEKPRFKRNSDYSDEDLKSVIAHKNTNHPHDEFVSVMEKDLAKEVLELREIIAEAERMAEWYEGPECTVIPTGTNKNPAREFLKRLSK